jgi:microcystin-dependent protein
MAPSPSLPPPLPQGEYPIGTITAYSAVLNQGDLQAQGWLYCNGNTVPRVTYADLYAVIGNNYGSGDGSSTFNLPDLRGYILRGANNGKTPPSDPNAATRVASLPGGSTGDKVGSAQAFATGAPSKGFTTNSTGDHTHSVPNLPNDNSSSAVAGSYQSIWNDGSPDTDAAGDHSHTVTSGGDLETVPINAYTYYIIKFKDV